jgi:hypothetical protein
MINRRQSTLFQSKLLKRTKKTAALCAFACLLACMMIVGVSASAAAEEPKGEGGPEENRELGYILLGTSCALGLGMAGALLFVRRRRRDEALLDFEGFGASDERAFTPSRRTMEASGRTADASQDSTSVSTQTVLDEVESSVGFAQQMGGEPARECPKCSRTFPSTIVVCPYDAATLRPAKKTRKRNRRRKNKRHGLERMACTGCERRYEAGVDFCYHDGLPLMQDTRERSYDAPSFKACERCGWEGLADDQTLCPTDSCSHELIEIDPSDSTHVQPTIPMTICPTCREYGTPGQAFCPNDGDVFTPLLNMRSTEFPARGFGPRRKACGECGAEHGGHAAYCSNDGSRLIALN